MCRATYLGHRNIVGLLIKYGADVNIKSHDGRTSLHWAAFRDNVQLIEFLLENGADRTLVDKDGWNPLDIAIIRINYKAARALTKAGCIRKEAQDYEGKTWRKYDTQMMIDSLDADLEDVPYKQFFDKIRREREEWLSKDLVVDRREGYRKWIWRQLNFENAPLVPREELPEHLQPQNSIRGKVVNYINGIDPRLPKTAVPIVNDEALEESKDGDVEMQTKK